MSRPTDSEIHKALNIVKNEPFEGTIAKQWIATQTWPPDEQCIFIRMGAYSALTWVLDMCNDVGSPSPFPEMLADILKKKERIKEVMHEDRKGD